MLASNKSYWDWDQFWTGLIMGYLWLGFIMALFMWKDLTKEYFLGLILAFFGWAFIINFFGVVW